MGCGNRVRGFRKRLCQGLEHGARGSPGPGEGGALEGMRADPGAEQGSSACNQQGALGRVARNWRPQEAHRAVWSPQPLGVGGTPATSPSTSPSHHNPSATQSSGLPWPASPYSLHVQRRGAENSDSPGLCAPPRGQLNSRAGASGKPRHAPALLGL